MLDEDAIEKIRARNPDNMPGLDWANDDLFFTHTWLDETSQFDEHPSKRWCGGSECYEREFKARVPIAFKYCEEWTDRFIESMIDNNPSCEGFWVE